MKKDRELEKNLIPVFSSFKLNLAVQSIDILLNVFTF